MLRRRPLRTLAMSALLGIAGCGANDREPIDEGASEINACSSPRKYIVSLADGQVCETITGYRGQWVPSPLFPDAPPGVSDTSCVYDWKGEPYSRGDQTALHTTHTSSLAVSVTPVCGESASRAISDVGELEAVEELPAVILGGANGCDVCGKVRDGKLWVILPSDREIYGQLKLKLSNGKEQPALIQVPAGTRATVLELPAAPRGTTYEQGNVTIW